jgi:hypothetical protein
VVKDTLRVVVCSQFLNYRSKLFVKFFVVGQHVFMDTVLSVLIASYKEKVPVSNSLCAKVSPFLRGCIQEGHEFV